MEEKKVQIQKHTTTEYIVAVCEGRACQIECRCSTEKTANQIARFLESALTEKPAETAEGRG